MLPKGFIETEEASVEEVFRGWFSGYRNGSQDDNVGYGVRLAPKCPKAPLLCCLHKAGQGPRSARQADRATGHDHNPRRTLKDTGSEEWGDKGNQSSRDKEKLTHWRNHLNSSATRLCFQRWHHWQCLKAEWGQICQGTCVGFQAF